MTENGNLKNGRHCAFTKARSRLVGWAVSENPKFREELKKALPYIFLGLVKHGFLKRWAERDFMDISFDDREMLTTAEHEMYVKCLSIMDGDPAFFSILMDGWRARCTEEDSFRLALREYELALRCCIRCLGLTRKYPRLFEIFEEVVSSLLSTCFGIIEQSAEPGAECTTGYDRETQAWRNLIVDFTSLGRPLADSDEKCGDTGRFRTETADAVECYYLHKAGKSYSEIGAIMYGDRGPAGKQKAAKRVRYFYRVAGLGPVRVQGRKDPFAKPAPLPPREEGEDFERNLENGIYLSELIDRLEHDNLNDEDNDKIRLVKNYIAERNLSKGGEITRELVLEVLRQLKSSID